MDKHYTKVGRLKTTIAKSIHRKSADIYISENHLQHIYKRHSAELDALGLTNIEFVRLIINGFNQIREGKNEALLLVIYNSESNAKVVVIELNLALKKKFYEVKTATAYRKENINKKTLLWQKSAPL
jgi:hypothetical protein